MFPEYRDLISRLKTTNTRFQSLFEKHNAIDHEVSRLEGVDGSGYSQEVAQLKKEKLLIKDELHKILQKESQQS